MSADGNRSQINIVKVKESTMDEIALGHENTLEGHRRQLMQQNTNKKCNTCCMLSGLAVSIPLSLALSFIVTGCYCFVEKKINYTINGAMKQVVWMALPSMVVSTTLHFYLSEAMWSQKKNTWGSAWVKAVAANTIMWGSLVGGGTLMWNKVLPKCGPRGRRLYKAYPHPADSIEIRQMRSKDAFFSGMCRWYWGLSILGGQVGFCAAASFAVSQDKLHYMMNPLGSYAANCMPRWRSDQILHSANYRSDMKL